MFEDTNPERWTPERAANDAKIWVRKYLPAGTLPQWEEPRIVAALRRWNLAQPAHKRFKTWFELTLGEQLWVVQKSYDLAR
jgi:hypothetical protein